MGKELAEFRKGRRLRRVKLEDFDVSPEPSPDELYNPMVDRRIFGRYFNKYAGDLVNSLILISPGVVVGGHALFVTANSLVDPSFMESNLLGLAFSAGSLLILTTAAPLALNRWLYKPFSNVVQLNVSVFSRWLEKRYGLVVSDDQKEWISYGRAAGGLKTDEFFTSVDGRKFQVQVGNEGSFVVENVETKGSLTTQANAAEIVRTEGNVFVGDAGSLWETLQRKMEVAVSGVASVEKDHVLARVRQDVEALSVLVVRMKTLEAEYDNTVISNALMDLCNEVQSVIDAETAGLQKDIRTQVEWIRERRKQTSSVLVLEKTNNVVHELSPVCDVEGRSARS